MASPFDIPAGFLAELRRADSSIDAGAIVRAVIYRLGGVDSFADLVAQALKQATPGGVAQQRGVAMLLNLAVKDAELRRASSYDEVPLAELQSAYEALHRQLAARGVDPGVAVAAPEGPPPGPEPDDAAADE